MWRGAAPLKPPKRPRQPSTFTFKPARAGGEVQENLSFGSETGRTRSGTKGISGKSNKKTKRKKQEYHIHRRAYAQESERLKPAEVRARTILALDRLGHQVLSTEPGGYDLEDWLSRQRDRSMRTATPEVTADTLRLIA